MAHPDETRRAVRAAYVFDQLSLDAAALANDVPVATARRWRADARAAGDDWDRARSAQLIAGGGIEAVVRQTLAVVVQQVQATVDLIQQAEEMPPGDKVALLASLADAYNKLMAASRKLMPATDTLAVRLDTLRRLGDYLHTHAPRHAAAFAEVLEPFAETLTRD